MRKVLVEKVEKIIDTTVHSNTHQSTDTLIENLIKNSKSAILAAVEIHNKPIFAYRYETAIILTINAWELAMKAYILKYHSDIRVINESSTKEFSNCVNCISQKLGNEFLTIKTSLDLLYKYRCDVIHFYGEGVESMLYSLLRPNILHFGDFIKQHFQIDLSEEANLIILPIGFKRLISPIDFFTDDTLETNGSVKAFIKDIVHSAKVLAENGIEDGLLCNVDMHVDYVEKIKNADIVVGITRDPTEARMSIIKVAKGASFTNDPTAPKYKIDEESIFKSIFIFSSTVFFKKLRDATPGFKATKDNMQKIRTIKEDANFYKERSLDGNPTSKSVKKGFYSEAGVAAAIALFKD